MGICIDYFGQGLGNQQAQYRYTKANVREEMVKYVLQLNPQQFALIEAWLPRVCKLWKTVQKPQKRFVLLMATHDVLLDQSTPSRRYLLLLLAMKMMQLVKDPEQVGINVQPAQPQPAMPAQQTPSPPAPGAANTPAAATPP